MTLRQAYARPRHRAIARDWDQPACGLRRWIPVCGAVAAGSGDCAGSCGCPVGDLQAVMCGEHSGRL
jgi:hypothetical protein